MAGKTIRGKGTLNIEVELEGEVIREFERCEEIPNSQPILDVLKDSNEVVNQPAKHWGELSIYFSVNAYFYSGDYNNPPESSDERSVYRVTVGTTKNGKWVVVDIPDNDGLYDKIHSQFESRIDDADWDTTDNDDDQRDNRE